MPLVQARDGRCPQLASPAFTDDEIKVIALLNARLQGKTDRQKNPHPPNTLAWAARVIAKLGGWHEYETKPPGPITFYNGLTYFRAFAAGWVFKNVDALERSGAGIGEITSARRMSTLARNNTLSRARAQTAQGPRHCRGSG